MDFQIVIVVIRGAEYKWKEKKIKTLSGFIRWIRKENINNLLGNSIKEKRQSKKILNIFYNERFVVKLQKNHFGSQIYLPKHKPLKCSTNC